MQNIKFEQIQKLSLDIKQTYDNINQKDGHQKWKVEDYTMGMVGDCGDLCKLITAKNKLRRNKSENLNQDIEHELVDILWSLIVIADQLDINLEEAAINQLNKLKQAVEKVASNQQNIA
jgi:NTP pyrophosphatase (non-canonical NTP hydrolase)